MPELLERVVLDVNGETHELEVEPRWTLVDVLRTQLGLTGTHVGCEHGICGACTVLLDDRPVRSCLTLAVQAQGHRVETVESLAGGETASALQLAFSRERALQCGFCTPGFLLTAEGLRREVERPTDEDVEDAVSASLCRCTGYAGIVAAVSSVVRADS
jgi:carbon-monoxide dehydrogenase small subunit